MTDLETRMAVALSGLLHEAPYYTEKYREAENVLNDYHAAKAPKIAKENAYMAGVTSEQINAVQRTLNHRVTEAEAAVIARAVLATLFTNYEITDTEVKSCFSNRWGDNGWHVVGAYYKAGFYDGASRKKMQERKNG